MKPDLHNFVELRSKISYPDGSIYVGECNKRYEWREGRGVYKYSNGDLYEGEFVRSKREGFGKQIYLDKSVYQGYWEKDMKHGEGK